MKLRSSIFSFETLRGRVWRPWALVLTAVLLTIANLAAAALKEKGVLFSSVPRQRIEASLKDMSEAQDKHTWILGNSTLASGIDGEALPEQGSSVLVVLSSATFPVLVGLAERALARTQNPPRNIVIFATKDDLNANGDRAHHSKRYHQAFSGATHYERLSDWLPVHACRYSIRERVIEKLTSVLISLKGGGKQTGASTRAKVDLSQQISSTYLYNQGRNYEIVPLNLALIARLARERNTRVTIVLPPVTRSIERWQEIFAPHMPWPRIRDSLEHEVKKHGILLLDYTDLLPSTNGYFRDVYHLNESGARLFTERLARDLS